MFCYQCEQTSKGTGCTSIGVCGKSHEVATLQDLLLYSLKELSMFTHRTRLLGEKNHDIDIFMLNALFATLTNVNFDPERLKDLILKSSIYIGKMKEIYEETSKKRGFIPENISVSMTYNPEVTIEELVKQGEQVTILKRKEKFGDDITGLQELLTYGLKGVAAYAYHAQILGQEDESIYNFIHEALNYLTNESPSINELLSLSLKCGEINFKAMEILDKANTDRYGHPEPTRVRIEPIKGKAILVSGHDLKDLEEILKQTEGKGINVYTHGEMLPANAYPGLKKYKHLVGNYGSAWQNQKKEFAEFPGAILMTTNCIQKPQDVYKERIFTSGPAAFEGVKHIYNHDFSPVIESALNSEGFKEDGPDKFITIGFARNTVISIADKVIEAVKNGSVKHFFLIGGCDGAKTGRSYYTELAQSIPKDSIILTLACGKYRFNKLEFGDINGIPRLLDIGQCNDAYSAILIAQALANAFNTDVNSLPLSLILSWYEQKAVAILLTLLYLGIKNIRLGPSLPAFITPTVLNVLVEKFCIKPITTPQEDLKSI